MRGQGGAVAQHLVGAKLQVRFPNTDIGNCAYSAADEQSGRCGDFQVGHTAFHVTVAPTPAHVQRCKQNLRDGIQPFVIVPDSKINRARVLIDVDGIADEVAVESVESFVGQNISELAEFTPDRFITTLGDLLRTYNCRVAAVETDTSLLIEIPGALGVE